MLQINLGDCKQPADQRSVAHPEYIAGWMAAKDDATRDRDIAELAIVERLSAAWEMGRVAGRDQARAEIIDAVGPIGATLLPDDDDPEPLPTPTLGQLIADLLGRADDIGRTARGEARKTSEQRVAERIADMERSAPDTNRELGRHPEHRYRGGPVDWDTGLPAGSACAWFRRTRTTTSARGVAA